MGIIILVYYVGLGIGVLFIIVALIFLIVMYVKRKVEFGLTIKMLGAFLMGALILWITIPSLKSVVTKDFEVINGQCTIEITKDGRYTDWSFNMIDTGEQFSFIETPELEAYGKATPYYCEITVTRDHMWEIGYKIYDFKTRKLIDSNNGG
ncbi:hypothetical protein AEA09_09165 [Lysinibacillus contaminans]|uniref:Uncharacterized protein n=1 Tax=Lysinibacillus contaminans TaxID=1293441 RepID=A0ABR5K1P5_9BACI|nr:hypothetical protein [Lysinibacillus contaminans]KOS68693.1 hypothetical protein AEA09_09165 [Lysinibacillus contaminans]